MSSCKAGVYYMYVTGVSVRNLQAFQVLQQVFLKVNAQEDYVKLQIVCVIVGNLFMYFMYQRW